MLLSIVMPQLKWLVHAFFCSVKARKNWPQSTIEHNIHILCENTQFENHFFNAFGVLIPQLTRFLWSHQPWLAASLTLSHDTLFFWSEKFVGQEKPEEWGQRSWDKCLPVCSSCWTPTNALLLWQKLHSTVNTQRLAINQTQCLYLSGGKLSGLVLKV